CGKKIGPDPRNFNQRVSLGRNDLLIRTFLRAMKRKSLEWYALRKSTANNVNVKPYIAIPYNPESLTTNNYTRHAAQYDRQDLLVGDELWKLASNGIFGLNDMNRIFQELGEETRMVINSALQR
ncbi:TdeIII family type II restriction endonuclease, partial [Enterobacter roggenkampii]|uniref:TdeIII family type II restriction endonuclease n=1 Tax=Enterobacter roggenkampii TaxID=1812935 RepID=UPI0020064A8C